MALERKQLEEMVSKTKAAYKSAFGVEVEEDMLLECVERELRKQQIAVVTNRLCNQRAARDLVGLHDILSEPGSPEVKPEPELAPVASKKKTPRKKSSYKPKIASYGEKTKAGASSNDAA